MSDSLPQSRDNRNHSSSDSMAMSSMSSPQQYPSDVHYYDETGGGKLSRKVKDNPFFPIAMTGFTCAVLYGAYRFKHRGDMPISLYLIHLRVAAQGMAVGTLSLGMVYMLGQRLYKHWFPDNEKTSKS